MTVKSPTATIYLQAAENHYRELFPRLQRRDNLLFFAKEGVVLVFEDNEAVLVSGCEIRNMRQMIECILAITPKSNLDKINQKRAWLYLFKKGTVCRFDYGDPHLFQLTDKVLAAAVTQ
jgi:hypothetical protein